MSIGLPPSNISPLGQKSSPLKLWGQSRRWPISWATVLNRGVYGVLPEIAVTDPPPTTAEPGCPGRPTTNPPACSLFSTTTACFVLSLPEASIFSSQSFLSDDCTVPLARKVGIYFPSDNQSKYGVILLLRDRVTFSTSNLRGPPTSQIHTSHSILSKVRLRIASAFAIRLSSSESKELSYRLCIRSGRVNSAEEKLLGKRRRSTNSESRLIWLGIFPVNLLWYSCRSVIFLRFPISFGIVPVRLLLPSQRVLILVRLPIVEGILPDNSLYANPKKWSSVRFPISWGIGPLNEFRSSHIEVSSESEPSSMGRVPEMDSLYSDISVTLVRSRLPSQNVVTTMPSQD